MIGQPPPSKELEIVEETVNQELEEMKPNITPFDFERSLNEVRSHQSICKMYSGVEGSFSMMTHFHEK